MSKASTPSRPKAHPRDQHGATADNNSRQQASDPDRARSAEITAEKEQELQALKEQSGF